MWLANRLLFSKCKMSGTRQSKHLMVLAVVLAATLASWLAGREGRFSLAFALITTALLYVWGWGFRWAWRAARRVRRQGRYLVRLIALVILVAGGGLYTWLSVWALRPNLLPQQTYYDFIANRRVTERLVDPVLLKVERWEILGEGRDVLFVHPAPSGSVALVYPVRIEPATTLQVDLAVALEAWDLEGDGLTFSVYVEDDSGMHLVHSRYVDPKHHQQDRRWVPTQVNLAPFGGKLVRLILVTGSGPAGDQRYDWAGWGEPRLECPVWP
jgi:hypothetical protein